MLRANSLKPRAYSFIFNNASATPIVADMGYGKQALFDDQCSR